MSEKNLTKMKKVIADFTILGVILFGFGQWQTRCLLSAADSVDAPPFNLSSIDGGTYKLGGKSGKPAVFYFFAPWCGVCEFTSGNVQKLKDALGDNLTVLAVALSYDSQKSVRGFAEQHKLNIPVLLGNNEVMDAYNISAYPTFYFIDNNGKVSNHTVGYTSEFGLRMRY